MPKKFEITAQSPFLRILEFRPYGYRGKERKAEQFIPDEGQPQTREVQTPWGETLMAERGDYIVSDVENPADTWVVKKGIFDTTYVKTRANSYIKTAAVYLVPLTDITGNPNEEVVVKTLEGPVTVRSGDFYLARGTEQEIWPIPKEKVEQELTRLD